MTDAEVKVVLGGLLHDIGKVIYRTGSDTRKHSRSGYDFLREEVAKKDMNASMLDDDILNCVLYHHADALRTTDIEQDALAYIVYMADNIASSADRREAVNPDTGFETTTPLQSVFNILNGNKQDYYYHPGTIKDGINYPSQEKKAFEPYFYKQVADNIRDNLYGISWSREYINSLIEIMEANLSFVPSSTAKGELADISLFDHVKLTAGIASCIYEVLKDKGIDNYRDKLYIKGSEFYSEEAFILYSMDISGIQNFIYTITSKNALKTLRARSFYLEIMMEHIIDCLLDELNLSRANLLYSGGGHCYMLLPNTDSVIKTIESYNNNLNGWIKEKFDISLYVAYGYAPCSSDTLKNIPNGSYSALFQKVSRMISDAKLHRYSVGDIIKFNNADRDNDHSRECKVCKSPGKTDENDLCEMCASIEQFSKNILYGEFFAVTDRTKSGCLPLPNGYYLSAENEESLKKLMSDDAGFARAYGKNNVYTGKHISTKLWVGDYTSGNDFKKMAEMAEGIDRIAILRADVDNMGQAFVCGFENPGNGNRYVTLSRTATLSRQLSMFFKYYINQILSNPVKQLSRKNEYRNATIVYSGGDDVFIAGSWDDVIGLSIDLKNAFEEYTQGMLTMSAGIGVYSPGYPISAIASEVSEMESASKKHYGKDSITLFEDGSYHSEIDEGVERVVQDGTYKWKVFEEEVLNEKYLTIRKFFDQSEERGKNFLYNILELIRNRNERINFARFVYLLSRLEPESQASAEQKDAYQEFSTQMIKWIKNDKDSRELKTAINIYAYLTREKEGE